MLGRQKLRGGPRGPQARPGLFAEFFAGFDWDISFLAFLYYCFAVITFYLPGADVAIVLALATLSLRTNTLRGHPYLLTLFLVVAWTGLTMLNSEYRSTSWLAWWTLAKTALVGVVSFLVIRNRVHLKIVLAFLVGCFFLFPLRGAFFNYFGGYTLSGRVLWNYTYENPNELALHGLVFLSAAMALYFLVQNRLTRLAILTFAPLCLLLILFTQSRGTFLAAVAAGLVGLFGQKIRIRPLLTVVMAVGIAAWFTPTAVWERLGGLRNVSIEGGMKGVDEGNSAEQRFLIAKIAAQVAESHPLLGVGIGAYPRANAVYADKMGSDFTFGGGARDAHNTYLLLAAELGVPGLVAFMAMMLSASFSRGNVTRRLSPVDRLVIRMMRLGLFGFCIASVFGSFAYSNVLYILLGIMAASPAALSMSAEPSRARGAARTRVQRPSLAVSTA